MVSSLIAVLSRLPLRLAWLIGWALAWIWWTALPIRRAVAVDNLRQALPEVRPGPALRRMMAGLVLGYVEMLHQLRRPCIEMEMDGLEPLRAHLATGQGCVVLMGHFDCWDLVGPLMCYSAGVPGSAVINVPANKDIAALIERVRLALGVIPIPGNSWGAARRVFEHLEEGRVVAFFLDQRFNGGIPVDLFGRPAWTTRVPATLAARAGVPVFTAHYWRVGVGRHRGVVEGPLTLSGDADEDTRRFAAFYEEKIRERPHNWLWLHRRWKPGRRPAASGDNQPDTSAGPRAT